VVGAEVQPVYEEPGLGATFGDAYVRVLRATPTLVAATQGGVKPLVRRRR
jgi:hypothetical protein